MGIYEQEHVKRALEVADDDGHNVVLNRSSAAEMPEFGQHGLAVLRQPLDPAGKSVTISRAVSANGVSLTFPAHCAGRRAESVSLRLLRRPGASVHVQPQAEQGGQPCSALISRYQKRLSGPLLDRIVIHVEAPRARSRS